MVSPEMKRMNGNFLQLIHPVFSVCISCKILSRLSILAYSILFVFTNIYAQGVKTVKATYEYVLDQNTETVDQGKKKAIHQAKVKALEQEFGSIVANQTHQVESLVNDKSNDEFYSLSMNEVKGEWIETINENTEVKVIDQDFFIVATVEGKARALNNARPDIIAKALKNGTALKYADTNFKDGDDLFLYFSSPVNGYLTVYLEDNRAKEVYSLLPYRTSSDGNYEIKHDDEYVFFSPQQDKGNPYVVDEYTMSCENEVEYNTLHVVFSPNKFYKPKSSNTTGEDASILPLKQFQDWLYKNRLHDKEMLDYTINITIKK